MTQNTRVSKIAGMIIDNPVYAWKSLLMIMHDTGSNNCSAAADESNLRLALWVPSDNENVRAPPATQSHSPARNNTTTRRSRYKARARRRKSIVVVLEATSQETDIPIIRV